MKLGPVEFKLGPPRGSANGDGALTLDAVLERYDVVGVVDNADFGDVLITTPKGGAERYLAEAPTEVELGASATKWRRVMGGDEYNDSLAGQKGLSNYEKMRRGDASVRSSLRLAKTPVLGARWYVVPPDPEDPLQVEQAEFTTWNLFYGMSISWSQFLVDALLMLDYGYSFFEKVFQLREWRGQPRWTWKKFGPRSALDVTGWNYDSHGGPSSVEMVGWESMNEPLKIDVDKLLIFTFDKEVGNIEGISLLRSAYKHWFFKENLYKIDAIQKERHGIGIPMIKLPPNFSERDKLIAQNMGRNLRTNEMAHIVLPPNWEVVFVKVEGQNVDVMKSIEHHDTKLYDNVLGAYLTKGGNVSREQEVHLFLRATRVVADIIADVINKYAIPELIDYNWSGTERYPMVKVRRIGDTADQRTLSFALRNLVGAKIIVPDDKLEEWARDEFEVPQADPETAREIDRTPRQDGQSAGLPRQSAPGTETGAGGERGNSGNDGSGG